MQQSWKQINNKVDAALAQTAELTTAMQGVPCHCVHMDLLASRLVELAAFVNGQANSLLDLETHISAVVAGGARTRFGAPLRGDDA